jgi:hypothetical protein
MGYMEATESRKYPFLTTRDTSPSRAVLEVFKLSPSDGCPAFATCLAATHPPVLEPHMVLNLPLDECIDNTHTKVTREKRKGKETNKKKLQEAIKSQTKAKSKIT